MNINERLERNEKAIDQIEKDLRKVRETDTNNYSLHSKKQDELIECYKKRCRLLTDLSLN